MILINNLSGRLYLASRSISCRTKPLRGAKWCINRFNYRYWIS